MTGFDDIIEKLGSFGRYQIRVFVLVSLSETPCAWAMVLAFFTHATPKLICPNREIMQQNDADNTTVSIRKDQFTTNQTSYCRKGNIICNNYTFEPEFTSIVTEWSLLCGQDYIPSMITTIQMIGVLVGAGIVGQLADTFGRKKVYFITYTLMLITTLCSALSPTWQVYTALKFTAGITIGGTLVIGFVLPMEFIGPKWRTFCGCVGFWAVGIMTIAGMAYLLRDWKHLTYAASLCGLPLLFTWWWVPESPRWLIQHNRSKEAEAILTQMAKTNNKSAPDLSQISSYFQKENDLLASRRYSYWDLFRTCSMSKNSVILLFSWFVSSAVYYGTNFNVRNLSGDKYLNYFISGMVEYPALIVVILANNKIGRKKTMFGFFLLSGVSCFAILIVDLTGRQTQWSHLLIVLAMLGRSGVAGGWAVTQVISAELFPTVVRNIGVGACSMAARIGGAIAPQLVFLDKFVQFLPFTIFGTLSLLCAFLSVFLPETLNKPLPDSVPPRAYRCCWESRSRYPKDEEPMSHRESLHQDNVNNYHEEIKDMLTVF